MDAPVCVRGTRTGRQDEHGFFLFHEELRKGIIYLSDHLQINLAIHL